MWSLLLMRNLTVRFPALPEGGGGSYRLEFLQIQILYEIFVRNLFDVFRFERVHVSHCFCDLTTMPQMIWVQTRALVDASGNPSRVHQEITTGTHCFS